MTDNGVTEAGGVRLAYRARGNPGAPPLVALHGLGEGAADRDGVAPAFARHWRVYAPDLRGPARPPGQLSFDWDMVLAIRRQLSDPDPAWWAGLDQITAATLVIGGGPASHIPQGQVAELARRIPAARLETIPAGHLIHAAAPAAFSRAALAFLRPA